MKYIKILFIIIITTSFVYYKFKQDESTLFEDKLSMFIFVKSHNNIDDILFDLSSQIESFNEYIYNVQYIRDNKFLIKNKLKSQFDIDYISYKDLLNSSNIIDFNIRIGKIIEGYFLDHRSSLHLTKEYLLRDFLIRFNQYFKYQESLLKKEHIPYQINNQIEDFILGSKYITDYKQEYYMIRIEFNDLESIANYKDSGMDKIFESILDYNSKTFKSELIFYNPYNDKLLANKFNFKLKQYIKEFNYLDEALEYHRNLMLSDNVFLVESIYDYYFSGINNKNKNLSQSFKLHSSILDSNYHVNQKEYKNSLLLLEEKLIALQSDDLTDDPIITSILDGLVGDGYIKGSYSKYIDSINLESNYITNNINRLFSYQIQSLFNKVDQAENEFEISLVPLKIKKHFFPKNTFKVRYFIEQ